MTTPVSLALIASSAITSILPRPDLSDLAYSYETYPILPYNEEHNYCRNENPVVRLEVFERFDLLGCTPIVPLVAHMILGPNQRRNLDLFQRKGSYWHSL